MSLLEMTGIRRDFGRRPVLKNLDLTIDEGETVLLRGANGSGKTTLLRIAATTLRPTAGNVTIGGAAGAEARRNLAFVPHDAPTYRELTPVEHIQFAAGLHGRTIGRGDAIVALRDAGLERDAHRHAGLLSRGQRQRLCLAAAFACAPKLLLLDEPATGLDDTGLAWLQEKLQSYEGASLAAVHGDQLPFDRELKLAGGRLQ